MVHQSILMIHNNLTMTKESILFFLSFPAPKSDVIIDLKIQIIYYSTFIQLGSIEHGFVK